MGHQMVAEVVTASLDRLGWDVEVIDGMRMLRAVAGRVGDWVFGRIVAIPTLYDGLHHRINLINVCHVHSEELCLAASVTNALDRAIAVRLGDVGHNYDGPGSAKRFCTGTADSRSRTGDKSNLARKIIGNVHRYFPLSFAADQGRRLIQSMTGTIVSSEFASKMRPCALP